MTENKITPAYLKRQAIVYIRQSSMLQVEKHQESQKRQYQLQETVQGLGVACCPVCGQCSADRFLHERVDPCLFGGGQLLQREGDRPQGAFVEVRRVAEA